MADFHFFGKYPNEREALNMFVMIWMIFGVACFKCTAKILSPGALLGVFFIASFTSLVVIFLITFCSSFWGFSGSFSPVLK